MKVAGVFVIEERYHTVTLNVLNNEVKTFQSMPVVSTRLGAPVHTHASTSKQETV